MRRLWSARTRWLSVPIHAILATQSGRTRPGTDVEQTARPSSHPHASAYHDQALKFTVKVDDLAYPIRVKFVVPEGGMQELSGRIQARLAAEFAPSAWSWIPAYSTACLQSTSYRFRSLAVAQRLVAAFPELQLADGVVAKRRGTSISALVPAGSRTIPRS